MESSDDAIISKSVDGIIQSWNAAAEYIYGYSAGEAIGRHVSMLLPRGRPDETEQILEKLHRGERIRHEETTRIRKDGREIPVLLTVSPIRDETGRITGLATVSRDITGIKTTEALLRKLEYIFEHANWGVALSKPDLSIDALNPAFAGMHGYTVEELRGKSMTALFAPEKRSEALEAAHVADETGHHIYETQHVRKDGTRFPVLTDLMLFRDRNGRVLFRAGYYQDITERKQLEEKLRETQKLESLGVLAGGIAHDFNNLLTGILGNASMALEELPGEHPVRFNLTNVIRAAEKAADLTRQMLAYSGKGRFIIRRIDISSLVHDTIDLIRSSIPKTVELQLNLREDLPLVEGDPTQIQQLVMNLVINGGEAIGERPGTVSIETGVHLVDEEEVAAYHAGERVRPGSYVCVEVRDTGSGMDEETKTRIFDPFFSTKFTGRGLGLAAASGIIRGHNGAIKVTSAPGKGSTFRVLLPAAQNNSGERQAAA